jgi:hypothetical protein
VKSGCNLTESSKDWLKKGCFANDDVDDDELMSVYKSKEIQLSLTLANQALRHDHEEVWRIGGIDPRYSFLNWKGKDRKIF